VGPSTLKSAVVGALVLATLPLWVLPVMAMPMPGFLVYLFVSNYYYELARLVFGPTYFPTEEFGTFARGAAGIAFAALLYAAIGAALGIVIALARRRHSDAAHARTASQRK
jgi:hypothetical protein